MKLSYKAFTSAAGRPFSALSSVVPGSDPVLLLHGFGASGVGWLSVAAPLSRHNSIIALDMPGHARSPATFKSITLDQMAQAVEAMATAVGVRSAHVVGHSMGAAIALQLASRRNLPLLSLTLISCAGVVENAEREFFDLYMNAADQEDMRRALQIATGPDFTITPMMARSALSEVADEGHKLVMSQMVEAGAKGKLRAPLDALDDFRPPLRVIWGQMDRITPVVISEHFRRWAAPIILPGVGHLPHIEAPARVAEIVRQTVDQSLSARCVNS